MDNIATVVDALLDRKSAIARALQTMAVMATPVCRQPQVRYVQAFHFLCVNLNYTLPVKHAGRQLQEQM